MNRIFFTSFYLLLPFCLLPHAAKWQFQAEFFRQDCRNDCCYQQPGEMGKQVGDTIRAFFNQHFEVLPQPEPLFEMTHIPMATFKKMPCSSRIIISFIIDIDNNLKKARLDVRKDEWASPQTVIRVNAPTEEDFIPFLMKPKNQSWIC